MNGYFAPFVAAKPVTESEKIQFKKNYPLYCPKCKQEALIDVTNEFTNNSHHRARHFRCRADEFVKQD